MKNIQSILITLFLFFITNTAVAQFGNNGYGNNGYGNNGYGNNGYGNSRGSIGQMQPRQPESQKEISAEENAKKVVVILKQKLQLDELQTIAVENIILDSMKQQGVILKKEADELQKKEDIGALSEATDRKIIQMLNKNQKDAYKKLVEDKN